MYFKTLLAPSKTYANLQKKCGIERLPWLLYEMMSKNCFKALFLFPMLSRKAEMRTVGPIVESVCISQRTLCKKMRFRNERENFNTKGRLNKNVEKKEQGKGAIEYSKEL